MFLVNLFSPGSGVSTETHTTGLDRISPIHAARVEGNMAKSSIDDAEAIMDILSEVADIR